MNPLSVVVLRTFDGKTFEPLTRESFSSYSEAMARIEELYSTLDLPDEEEPGYYEFLEDALLEASSPDFPGVAFVSFPVWTPGRSLSPNTFLEHGYVFPVMVYVDALPSKDKDKRAILVFSLFNEGKMTFPTFSSIELLYHIDTVFVTADPSLFGVSVSDKEVEGGEVFLFPITTREENEEGLDVYGVWPWEAYLLPTYVAYHTLKNLGKGERVEPVALLVTPEAIDANGGLEKASKKLLGSETLGVPVVVSFGEFNFGDGEEDEEY